jgi:hypothetical protein
MMEAKPIARFKSKKFPMRSWNPVFNDEIKLKSFMRVSYKAQI